MEAKKIVTVLLSALRANTSLSLSYVKAKKGVIVLVITKRLIWTLVIWTFVITVLRGEICQNIRMLNASHKRHHSSKIHYRGRISSHIACCLIFNRVYDH